MEVLPVTVYQVSQLSADRLVSVVQELAELNNQVTGLMVALTGEVEARSSGLPPEDSLARQFGCRNATELLQRATGDSAATIKKRIKLAQSVRPGVSLTGEVLPAKCEVVGQAMADGSLGEESARHIVDLVESCRTAHPEDLAVAELRLVESATGTYEDDAPVAHHADTIKQMCKAWKLALDPDGAVPSEDESFRRRTLHLGAERNGLVPMSAMLLPEFAAELGRLFDAIGNPKAGPSDPVLDVLEAVSPAQKRHDMFGAILSVAARSSEVPSLGGAPVTVLIQVKEEDFEAGHGTAQVHDHAGTLTSVPVNSARRAACSGAVQKIVQDRRGRIVSLGTPERVFNANQRRAIILRDKGCVIPGCTVPATWCEIHHVTEHANGGPTHTDNGALLCFFHHRNLERGDWEIKMVNGVPKVKPPPWLRRPRAA